MANAIDKEQKEMLATWWKAYGKAIAFAIIIGLILGTSWRYWAQKKLHHREQAAIVYQKLTIALSSQHLTSAKKLTKILTKSYADTPYAALAGLLDAKIEVSQHNLPKALSSLKWILAHSKVAPFKEIARIRASKILVEQKEYKQAQAMLSVVDDPSFDPLIQRITGDLYAAQGLKKQAHAAYRVAILGYKQMGVKHPYLAMELVSS